MRDVFNSYHLRIARLLSGDALADVAERVGKSRQYLHKLESGETEPTPDLAMALAHTLGVETAFFYIDNAPLSLEQFHFRKQLTSRTTALQAMLAQAGLFRRCVTAIEKWVSLPVVDFPDIGEDRTPMGIELAAERLRARWQLGFGPISFMTRAAENAGAVVTSFAGVSEQVDALSITDARPIIAINEAKGSTCRIRFDIAHEIGHLVIHQGVVTGDRTTESEAHRFAGAFLIPRAAMEAEFPRPRNGRINWRALSDFKLKWRVSKAALLYRARQLGLVEESVYRSGVITLKRTGEAIREEEDPQILPENPELLADALRTLRSMGIGLPDLAAEVGVKPLLLRRFLDDENLASATSRGNVIQLAARKGQQN